MRPNLDKKRLADAGGGLIGAYVGAVVLSFLGIMIEPVARIAHSGGWGHDLGLFAGDGFASWLSAYTVHIALFVLSVLMLVISACSWRRKRIGFEFALTVTLLPLVMCITSVAGIVTATRSGTLFTAPAVAGTLITDTYMIRFDEAAAELYHYLPAVIAALLTVTGLTLLVKVLRSDFTADTPKLPDEDDEDEEAPDGSDTEAQ